MKAIDLFAGAGGFTVGAEAAGVGVVWAANHWQAAVDIHEANHPSTAHKCQDLHQADWSQVPRHDLLLASPACQGHSPARGKDRPHHDAQRSTAWAVVSALEYHRPSVGVVENVPAFLRWKLYPAWVMAMNSLGYQVAPHHLDAADYGVAQNRVRVFLVVTRSAEPLHLNLPASPHVPVSSILEPIPARSLISAKVARTRRRVAAGRAAFGDRFVFPYYGSGSGQTGRSIERPIGTVTTRDRWALVEGRRMRMFTPVEYRRAMGFPDSYILPSTRAESIHMLGNAVCPPVATAIINELRRVA